MGWLFEKFVSDLFIELENNKIIYCVLRNYETLPLLNDGKDIDFLVQGDNLKDAIGIFEKVASNNRMGMKAVIPHRRYVFYLKKDRFFVFLPIDIHTNEESFGVIYLTGDDILKIRRKVREFYVPSEVDEALVSFLASYLSGGFIKRKYLDSVLKVIGNNKEVFVGRLSLIVGGQLSGDIVNCLDGEDPHRSLLLRRKMFCNIVWWSIKRRLLLQIISSLKFITRQVYIRFFTPGLMLVFLGTDGSGKSTVCSAVSEKNEEIFCLDKAKIIHWRPDMLPPLRDIFKPWNWNKTKPDCQVCDPHGAKPSNFIISLMRLSYYFVDFTVGYVVKIRKLLKKNRIVIFDRYFYDYYIDSYRGRINLPKWIIKIYGLFIPKPDLILCLGADAEIIHKRKPELPLEEVKRQVTELKKFCEKNKRAVWVDTGCSIEESINKALEAITSRMAARYEKK